MPRNFSELKSGGTIPMLSPQPEKWGDVSVMVCQCKCIERHMQSMRSVLEDDETRGR